MKYIRLKIFVQNGNTEAVSLFLGERDLHEFSIEGAQVREDVLASKEVARWDFLDSNKVEEGDLFTLYFGIGEKEKVISLKEEILATFSEERKTGVEIELIETKGRNNKDGHQQGVNTSGDKRFLNVKETIKVDWDIVDDEDWNNKWKESYKAKRISENIIVKPSWETLELVKIKEGDKVIEMDPGMAFGTGTHETTSMCIELMEKHNCKGKEVLDVGTGSGILAIAAAMLGATYVTAVDIDNDAVRVAKENVENNKVEKKISVIAGDLTKGLDLTADIVVANLISSLIIALAENLLQHMKEEGIFIASGILVEQMSEVIIEMENRGFRHISSTERNDWCALAFQVM